MHAKVYSSTTIGIQAHSVEVEVDVSFGLVNFFIVGLPDTAIKESSKRLLTALKNSGIKLPAKKITVNLAPADLKKEGILFDVPSAIGILIASQYLDVSKTFLEETLFLGELSLDGAIRPIKGALAIAYDAQRLGKKRVILPKNNAQEAALIEGLEIIGVEHLTQLVAYLKNEYEIQPAPPSFATHIKNFQDGSLDFAQVKGQAQAKRALQICAAGRHNILFVGPPGSGKTMLAKRLPSIMPAMTFDEILETTKIYSISGKLNSTLVVQRPFRDPHHTITQPGLVGGGSYPQPGEISLAHNGILFLDELTEFKRSTLEVLRQPLENKNVCISRANHAVSFPSSFLMVAALNPCPCGFLGDKKKLCTCNPAKIDRYLEKLSGPLLDRIDIQINVQGIEYDAIKDSSASQDTSATMIANVNKAVNRQRTRFANPTMWNAFMTSTMVDQFCVLTSQAETIMQKAFDKLHLSMRGYHKILKVARTIADIESSDLIDSAHIQEAIMYRSLDQALDKQRQ